MIIGDCTDETLVVDLFGSVSELARLIEEKGDEFIHGTLEVTYDEETDIHTFWRLPDEFLHRS